MARQARLKAVYLKSHESWAVNVPPALSDTGKRRQLFFDTKGEAVAVSERLKARKDNFGFSINAMTTGRIAEAAEAYKLLDPLNVSLLDAVRDYVDRHKQRNESIPLLSLFNLYLDAKKNRDVTYLRELRITRDRAEIQPLHDILVCDIDHVKLARCLMPISDAARNAVMRYLRAVFNYGIKKEFMPAGTNPVLRLDFADIPSREVGIIPHDQVEAMLNHALNQDLQLLPYLVLGFFAGIRPDFDGELVAMDWSDINFDTGGIVIRPEVSKTNRRRFPQLEPNALAWLKAYGDRGGIMAGKVMPYGDSELREHRIANWKAAGVTKWVQDGMRHTYCSNWLAKYKDVNKLVLLCGHTDVDTMWTAYHAGVPEAEAKRFWSILPPTTDNKIIRMNVSA